MDNSATKPKHDRATHEQLEAYVLFCQAHPEISTGKNCPKTPQRMKELWQQLAEQLNSCRGPIRSAAKWKETLGVWKSQLRTRARRLKMTQRLTGGGPSSKPMTDFEEMALSTFGSAAVDGMQNVQSLGLTPIVQTDECAISSPTGSPHQLCSQVDASPNPEHHTASPSSPSTYPSLENQDASTSVLSRSARNKLISTLIADIPKRNAAEEERRREHREMMQAIQGLTSSITELIKSFTSNKK
ncbi:uncharacterized protein LOC126763217 [Bactrocera neohumeralis]|uniref:uncharacterized protein LOC126763217 n=1 Tax=Bactrocera neohumeralis TaxID=98809 RepID=UPI002166A2C5|nr:uncharacterized protein LOC126763217 [Bactrocera neohumeralis]